MHTLNLTVPITIPQLAELLRTQFSAAERQQLVELMQASKPSTEGDDSITSSLRIAIEELNQYKRGEISLPTLQEFLDELQD